MMPVREYRRRPRPNVHAVRYAGDNADEVIALAPDDVWRSDDNPGCLTVQTIWSLQQVGPGDWVIVGADGCPTVDDGRWFAANYEPIGGDR